MKSIDTFLRWAGMAFLLLIAITLFAKCMGQQQPKLYLPKQSVWFKQPTGRYEFANPAKFVGWGILAIAGYVDGVVEGYEFDNRKSFERKWGKDPAGFWGSESWRRAYKSGLPDNGYRNAYTKHLGAMDFYHVGDDLRKYGYITGGITLAIGGKKVNAKWWHYALDFGIGFAVSGLAKRSGMIWIRE